MNEPIVSPFFIYFLNIADGIKQFLCALWAISIALTIFFGIGTAIAYDPENEEDEKIFIIFKKMFIRFTIALFISSLAYLLMPDKNTLLQMYIAKNLTYAKVEKIIKAGKDIKKELKRDIIDILILNKKLKIIDIENSELLKGGSNAKNKNTNSKK